LSFAKVAESKLARRGSEKLYSNSFVDVTGAVDVPRNLDFKVLQPLNESTAIKLISIF
jgi:hypothetical protein